MGWHLCILHWPAFTLYISGIIYLSHFIISILMIDNCSCSIIAQTDGNDDTDDEMETTVTMKKDKPSGQ